MDGNPENMAQYPKLFMSQSCRFHITKNAFLYKGERVSIININNNVIIGKNVVYVNLPWFLIEKFVLVLILMDANRLLGWTIFLADFIENN